MISSWINKHTPKNSLYRAFKKASHLSLALLLLITLIQVTSPSVSVAFNDGFAPTAYKNQSQYGLGVYYAPYETRIYATPNGTELPIEILRWSPNTSQRSVYSERHGGNVYARKHFIVFYPKLNIATLSMVGDDGEGWAEVIYDQKRQKTGWVKLREEMSPEETDTIKDVEHLGRFQPWLDFMRFNGKTAGIYWLTGVSEYNRSLRMSPHDKAKLMKVTMIRKIKVKHVRGNWMLVEVMDFNRSTPLGWIRWRDKEGRLMVFPNIAGKKTPNVLGLF